MSKPSIWPINKCGFPPTSHSESSAQCLADSTQPDRAEEKRIPQAQRSQLTQDYWDVQKEETIALAVILQWCAIQVGAPLDTFCRAVQELHRCLALVVDKSNWANMEEEIWAGVMNDPVVAVSPRPPMSRRTQSQTPVAEKPMAAIPPSTSELEGMTPPQDLALVPWRKTTTTSRGFPKVPEDVVLPALEGAYLPGALTLFDFSTLESPEMTVSNTPAKDEVHYHLEAWSQARIALPDASACRYLGPSLRDKDWAKHLFQVWTWADIWSPNEANFLLRECPLT